jgi:hypothetical protein
MDHGGAASKLTLGPGFARYSEEIRRFMEVQMRATFRIGLLSLLLCAPAHAQDQNRAERRDVEVGEILVCDTRAQVDRYIALYQGDEQAAVSAVNRAENDPHACGVATLAFARGPQVASTSRADMAFKILPILVVGIVTPDGVRSVSPGEYYTAFGVTEYDV